MMAYWVQMRFLSLILTLTFVNSMSINGPVLTRYEPCGLGVLYFDKVTDKLWRALISLGLYQQIINPEIEISFKQQVILYGSTINSTVVGRNDLHDFTIKPNGTLPKAYFFYVSITEANPLSVPAVTKFRFNNVTLCDDSIKLSQKVEVLNATKDNNTIFHHVCGKRSPSHPELTSLRTEAKRGDWPWHVAIMFQEPEKAIIYQCGGNIISSTAVLTAGHCLFLNDKLVPANQILVEAGVINLKEVNPTGRQRFVAERTILHPGYDVALATSDLAIIIVKPFTFTDYVQPICIWGPVYDKTALFGREAAVVGFGTTEQNKLSDTLRATNILVQNDTTCLSYSSSVYKNLLNEFTFCAGFGPTSGINPRNGDSGGGLVVPTLLGDHRITWFLRGVLSKCGVSLPKDECDPKYYVVYTDVGPHYSWIYHNAGLVYIIPALNKFTASAGNATIIFLLLLILL